MNALKNLMRKKNSERLINSRSILQLNIIFHTMSNIQKSSIHELEIVLKESDKRI